MNGSFKNAALATVLFTAFLIPGFARSTKIPASKQGPAASLTQNGKSKFFLTSLRLEDGSKLDPKKVRSIRKNLVLVKSARVDKAGYFAFVKAEQKAYGKKKTGKKTAPKRRHAVKHKPAKKKVVMKTQNKVPASPVFVQTEFTVRVGDSFNFVGFVTRDHKPVVEVVCEVCKNLKIVTVGDVSGKFYVSANQPGSETFEIFPKKNPGISRLVKVKVVPLEKVTISRMPTDKQLVTWLVLFLAGLTSLFAGRYVWNKNKEESKKSELGLNQPYDASSGKVNTEDDAASDSQHTKPKHGHPENPKE